MTGPVEDGEDPRSGLKIALSLVGAGLLAAWVAVWFVSSHGLTLPAGLAPPPVPDLPQPRPHKAADGHMVADPDWRRQPTGDDIARYYPEAAQQKHVTGRVVIACLVALDGQLTGCKTVSESPPGWGFGEAAGRLSGQFRMWPRTIDGQPVDSGQVRIPIMFSD